MKQMEQYVYWRRQKGPANSKSMKQAFYVYKDRMPKTMPKKREYVDGGTPLFNEVVKNVPVLSPKHQALVSRKIRENSLTTMVGVDHTEDDEEKEKLKRSACSESAEGADAQRLHQLEQDQPEGADAEHQARMVATVKKRKLYRQAIGTELPWFPHDIAPELFKS